MKPQETPDMVVFTEEILNPFFVQCYFSEDECKSMFRSIAERRIYNPTISFILKIGKN